MIVWQLAVAWKRRAGAGAGAGRANSEPRKRRPLARSGVPGSLGRQWLAAVLRGLRLDGCHHHAFDVALDIGTLALADDAARDTRRLSLRLRGGGLLHRQGSPRLPRLQAEIGEDVRRIAVGRPDVRDEREVELAQSRELRLLVGECRLEIGARSVHVVAQLGEG